MSGLAVGYGYDDLFLEELAGMGFTNAALNLRLLKEHSYVLPVVIQRLLDLNEEQQAELTPQDPSSSSSSSSTLPPPHSQPQLDPFVSDPSPLGRGIYQASVAVELDEKGQRTEAYPVYIAAIDNLTNSLAYGYSQALSEVIMANINHFLVRAEQLQAFIPSASSTFTAPASFPISPPPPALSFSAPQTFSSAVFRTATGNHPPLTHSYSNVDNIYPCILETERASYPTYGLPAASSPQRPLSPSISTPSPNPHPTTATTSSALLLSPGKAPAAMVDFGTQDGLAYALIQGVHEATDRLQREALELHGLSKVDAQALRAFDHVGYSFLDNAPHLFSQIRSHVGGLSAAQYLASFKGSFSGIRSPGKSGSQLFFTDDLQFILKSLTPEEFEAFRSMLFSYYQHMVSSPNSLIIKIFALYTLRTPQRDLH